MAGEQAQAPVAPQAPAAPAPGTPEHDAAMAAKFDASQAGTQPVTPAADQRPTWLPEKFKTPEDLVRSYTELEKKLGAPAAPAAAPPATPPAAPVAKPTDKLQVPTQDPASAVQDAGFDMAKLQAEYVENGDLKPETRTALEAKFGKDVVDSYIAGQRALADQYVAKVHQAAGGEEQLTAMLTWAQQGMTQAEKVAFNEATGSGNIEKANLAVSGLRARYEAAHGSLPSLVQPNSATTPGAYQSMEQVKADMRKPEYQKDPAFRAQVEARIAASPNLYTEISR